MEIINGYVTGERKRFPQHREELLEELFRSPTLGSCQTSIFKIQYLLVMSNCNSSYIKAALTLCELSTDIRNS